MKKRLLGFLALTMFGCGDGSSNEDGVSSTAIGGTGGHQLDSTTATGGAGGVGGEAPGVTVIVVDYSHAPMAGVPIVVNSADGAIVTETGTGADGKVSVEVPTGGSVSAFNAQDQQFFVQTTVAPPPGRVQFQFSRPSTIMPEASEVTTYAIGAVDYPVNTASIVATLDDNCDVKGVVPGQKLELNDGGCHGKSLHHLLIAAIDEHNHTLGWAQLDLQVAPGATVSLSPSLSQSPLHSIQVDIQDVPLPVHSVTARASVATSTAAFDYQVSKSPYNAASFEGIVSVPKFAGYKVCVSGSVEVGDVYDGSESGRYRCDDSPPEIWSVDASALQWVYITDLDTTDTSHPVVNWSATPSKPANVITVSQAWSNGTAWVNTWVLLPPDHPTTWRLGDLPDDLSSFRPNATSIPRSVQLMYERCDGVDGYSDVVDGTEQEQHKTAGSWSTSRLDLK
jgi:hypothetical protein